MNFNKVFENVMKCVKIPLQRVDRVENRSITKRE